MWKTLVINSLVGLHKILYPLIDIVLAIRNTFYSEELFYKVKYFVFLKKKIKIQLICMYYTNDVFFFFF